MNMKQSILRFLLFALLLSVKTSSFAYVFEVDGIRYGIIVDQKVEVIPNSYSGDIVIPDFVEYNETTYKVISIGANAFEKCSSLTSVTIPNSVTKIGRCAFYGCSSLTSITIPNSVITIFESAFSECSGLTSVTIPNSVTTIRSGVFSGCSSLTSITIPNSITYISIDLFSNCSSLTSITIPNSVTSIDNFAFCGCSSLTSVTIPNSVTSISENAFLGCSSIEVVTLLGGIVKSWFRSNTSIKKVILGDGVTSIGDEAFSNCSSLSSVTISNSVTAIGGGTFSGCSSLTSVTIPYSVTSIGHNAFSGCPIENLTLLCPNVGTWFGDIKTIKEVILGDRVITISNGAFSNCSGIHIYSMAVNPPKLEIDIDAKSIEVPVGSGCRYAITDYWNSIDTIYSMQNDKRLYPVPLFINGEKIVSVNGKTEMGIELEEGEVVQILPNNESTQHGLIMQNYNNITDTIIKRKKFEYNTSSCHKKNKIETYAYHTKVISLTESGTLVDKIGIDNINDVYSLKVNGEINGTDVLVIRKMKNLKMLDLKDATIVNGGTSYYKEYVTSENTIGSYFFANKEEVISIILPQNIETIEDHAFVFCKSLRAIIIPSSVKEISYDVFYGCDSLESVTILAPKKIGRWFRCVRSIKSVFIGDSVTTIGNDAFQYCESLTSISIPNSVTTIGNNAFEGCSSLTSVTIPNSVTSIGGYAFGECSSLTSFIIPNSVTSIDYGAFWHCRALTTVTIGNGVKEIYSYAFEGCRELKIVNIQDVAAWCDIVFSTGTSNPLSIAHHLFIDGKEIQDLIIPNSVTRIKQNAFLGCSSLTSVTIPNSVTSIGYGAFFGCSSLTSVTIPNDVTSIGAYAFSGCSSITSVSIGKSVSSIGDGAFRECNGLTSVVSLNTTPPQIKYSAFYPSFENTIYDNATLYVPKGCKTIYWLHPGWENFKNIVELDDSGVNDITVDPSPKSKGVYTIDGIKLSADAVNIENLPKGIYIINGEKVIIK